MKKINKRIFKIIEYFIKNQGEVHLKNIAEILEVNERTIRYDIDKINEELNLKGLKEIEKLSKGFFKGNIVDLNLLITNYSNIEGTFSNEFKDILILIKIAFEEKINVNTLCETFDLSRTTIKTSIKEVKDILFLYSLELIVEPQKGLKLLGKEENIRRLQLKLLNQYYLNELNETFEKKYIRKSIEFYFEEISINPIKLFINYIIKTLNRTISDEAYTTLTNYINIVVLRIKNNRCLSSCSNENFLIRTPEYEIISKSFSLLEANYSIKLNNFEELKLTDYFLGSHIYSQETSYYNNWIEIEVLVKRIIQEFSLCYGIQLNNDTSLIEGLVNHIKPTIHRVKNKIELENSIKTEFIEYYPNIFNSAKKALELLEEFIGEKISNDEISFIGMHFKASIDRNKIDQKETKNILIVCGFGYGTSKLLAQQIREHYNVNIVATIPLNQLEKYEEIENIDLIITTLDSNKIKSSIPIITIKTLLNEKEICILEKYNLPKYNKKILLSSMIREIENNAIILDRKKLIEGIKNNAKEIIIDDLKTESLKLSDLLREESILLNVKTADWKHAISVAGDLLIVNKIATQDYTEKMIQSIEKNGPYMVITDYVALPHSKNDDNVISTGMSLITLKEEINFPEGIKVNTILAFTSIDNIEHLDAITEFIEMLKKYDFFKKIRNATTPKKIIEQIKKYEFLIKIGKRN